MNVAQYTFQSPYPSPIQVGRLDPSSLKESSPSSQDTSSLLRSTNQTLNEAKTFKASRESEVKPTVSNVNSLDLYA